MPPLAAKVGAALAALASCAPGALSAGVPSPFSHGGARVEYVERARLRDSVELLDGEGRFATDLLRSKWTQYDGLEETRTDADRCGATVAVASCLWALNPAACVARLAGAVCGEVRAAAGNANIEADRRAEEAVVAHCAEVEARLAERTATVRHLSLLADAVHFLYHDRGTNGMCGRDLLDLFSGTLGQSPPSPVGLAEAIRRRLCPAGGSQRINEQTGRVEGEGGTGCLARTVEGFQAHQCWPAHIQLGLARKQHWVLLCRDLSARANLWVWDPMPLPDPHHQQHHVEFDMYEPAGPVQTRFSDPLDAYLDATRQRGAGLLPADAHNVEHLCPE